MIKQLWPAAPGYRALFTNGIFDYGEARPDETEDMEDEDLVDESLHIISWALVEHPDGTQHLDAVVQRDLESTRVNNPIRSNEDYAHMQLASMHTRRFGEEFEVSFTQ